MDSVESIDFLQMKGSADGYYEPIAQLVVQNGDVVFKVQIL